MSEDTQKPIQQNMQSEMKRNSSFGLGNFLFLFFLFAIFSDFFFNH